MESVLLLAVVGLLLALPGFAAVMLLFRPGEAGAVTRLAAVFGLGFAVAGGCAFVLASAHVFWLATFLPLWLAATTALWIGALRTSSLRDQAVALRADVAGNVVPLVLGAAVLVALLIIRAFLLHTLPGPHYVYYLNGIEIANAHGVPASTLEYGQGWPPATDKIFLDAFTGVLPLFDKSPLIGPGVLQWIAYAGAAVGLWASAWELGLRRMGILVPLLVLSNKRILYTSVTSTFVTYRAEEFGMAVAFCAFALGILALREGGWRRTLAAGIVLAAASGSHLVPTVLVVMMLAFVGIGELVRGSATRRRKIILRDGLALAATGGVIGLVIRLFAGGTFGLGGASSQASYDIVHTTFDPTLFTLAGLFVRWHQPQASHFYLPPREVLSKVTDTATGLQLSTTMQLLLLAGVLAAAVVLFVFLRRELGALAFAGFGMWYGVIAIGLFFSYRYTVWVDATFGVRRPVVYVDLALVLLGLGLVEAALLLLGKLRWKESGRLTTIASAILVVLAAVWLLPTARLTAGQRQLNSGQLALATWVRTNTPCNARFLVDQRSEGTMTALTGRYDLTEGMGPFLRPDRLPYVVNVFLGARAFFQNPLQGEAFLRQYHIDYVVLARGGLVGYGGPIPLGNAAAMASAPFLHLVLHTPLMWIYQVDTSDPQPVSPLLQGPYLHCLSGPAHF